MSTGPTVVAASRLKKRRQRESERALASDPKSSPKPKLSCEKGDQGQQETRPAERDDETIRQSSRAARSSRRVIADQPRPIGGARLS